MPRPFGSRIVLSPGVHGQLEALARGLHFATCGCKDLRLTGEVFATACSYPYLSACAAPAASGGDQCAPVEDGGHEQMNRRKELPTA
jgi:hypothetical protein